MLLHFLLLKISQNSDRVFRIQHNNRKGRQKVFNHFWGKN